MNREVRATPMQLLIKNNLTIIEPVSLKGVGRSSFLELTDVKKLWKHQLPSYFSNRKIVQSKDELISVGDSFRHNLVAFHNISEFSNWLAWEKFHPSKPSISMDLKSIFNSNTTDGNQTLRDMLLGSELYLSSLLFDEKTQNEVFRT